MNALNFHANGKLLLSGEYFVLDGAQAIGLPCKFGQSLSVTNIVDGNEISWKSKRVDGSVWFEAILKVDDLTVLKTSDPEIAKTLQQILAQVQRLNATFLKPATSIQVETKLEFERLWGLGTSSTLIYNLAKWADVDPFLLSSKTLGGSGYDIACAGANGPILYQLKDKVPSFESISFKPSFIENLYFIYLSKKQNSRLGIQRYRDKAKQNESLIKNISNLSKNLITSTNLRDFQQHIDEHEQIVSQAIELPKVKDLYFADFEGSIKSLGAWGGDFILAASEMDYAFAKNYFNKKGFETFLGYNEMIK